MPGESISEGDELQILHLEDRAEDAELVREAFAVSNIPVHFTLVQNRADYLSALERGGFDVILADNSIPGFDGVKALEAACKQRPDVPFVAVSGTLVNSRATDILQHGAVNYLSKEHLWQLVAVIRSEREKKRLRRLSNRMGRLVSVVQKLSLARSLEEIMAIVRSEARELTGADGATFVLRDGEFCYYAEEDAISPLWKGQRFPLETCISGWAMLNRQPAIIKDIYSDPRIPADAYRPTFVKSLAMVPIRTESPIGAIGNYWARQRTPTTEEVELLQALANTTAVAMENVQVYGELEKRVKDRTAQLEAVNQELESFSYAVSHDLGAPLRAIRGFTDIVLKRSSGTLDELGKRNLEKVCTAAAQMSNLMEDLLRLAKFSKGSFNKTKVNLSGFAREIVARLSAGALECAVDVVIQNDMEAEGDSGLLRAALENLLSNAWKYTSKKAGAKIEFGSTTSPDGATVFFIKDNGAGFDMQYSSRLFQAFQRLHSAAEFSGTGIGLATVQRIIQRHGGKIWAEAEVEKGATFYFTLA